MDFDENYLFGIVMNYTLSSNNLECKIFPILLLNLAPKLKIAENRQDTQGILEYLQSFKLVFGTYITFLKGYNADYLMDPKKFKNYLFVKRFVKNKVLRGVGTVPKNGFSQKRLLQFFLKIPVLECGRCLLKLLILSFCVEFNFINSL